MTGVAFAADPVAGAAAGGGLGAFGQFIPLILIFVVFYFLLIRPQQKQAKQHQAFLSDLKKGYKIVTKGGIHGEITGLTDKVVTLEVAKGVEIKVSRDAIAGALTKEGVPESDKSEAKKIGG
ncbi:MAG: preprotein translocase subunit YajC [Desulfoprunum sp.]|jgi:preprotein translocase subunit YajC|nr:preprotein translocase subunit YajC [Desulfobulbus sp. Tol-SR]